VDDRLTELPKDSRLLLMEAERVLEAKNHLVYSRLQPSSEAYTVDEADFMLFIRKETLLKLRSSVESRDPSFSDFTDGEVRLMNDSLPVRLWR
jgi:hypothetical protein